MAMVTVKQLLPPDEAINRLRRLSGPLRLYKARDLIQSKLHSEHAALYLRSDEAREPVKLTVEYADVVFKFEIFNLVIRASESRLPVLGEVAVLQGWDQIACLVAFEWQRPALKGEVRSDWEQIVCRRGLRNEVPSTAMAVGISVVGIVFNDTSRKLPVGLIFTDQDDPCSLLVLQDIRKIQDFIFNCETVAVGDFSKWRRDFEKWCASFKTHVVG